MRKIFQKVDHPGVDGALPVNPGEKSGSTCEELVNVGPAENFPTYQRERYLSCG